MAVGRGSVFTAGTQLGYRLTGNPERHLSVLHFEEQILGQVRSALKPAQEQGILGRVLGDLGRLALRAGSLLQALGVGCNAPAGAYAAGAGQLRMQAAVTSGEGRRVLRARRRAS
jgi:Porphobilinogen deaminase, C-terminal domain/Glutamyl-tRNAGlu reductase, N-terminal domain